MSRKFSSKLFFEAMNKLDDRYIEEVLQFNSNRKRYFSRRKRAVMMHRKHTLRLCPKNAANHRPLLLPAAAGLCLIVSAVFLGSRILHRDALPDVKEISGITVSGEGITIPPLQISLSAEDSGTSASMIPFFIYQGQVYTQYEILSDSTALLALTGEYLGTASGLIDEWTPDDGYVELAGSVSGDFYSAKGYEPSFMLLLEQDDGPSATYICGSGITLKYGSELFEERLHLSGYISAEYESRESWYYSQGIRHDIEFGQTDVLNSFISAMNSAEFIPTGSIPLDEGETSVYDDREIFHLYFHMPDSMTVELRLFEGGYVSFEGIPDVCVQVPDNIFEALVKNF